MDWDLVYRADVMGRSGLLGYRVFFIVRVEYILQQSVTKIKYSCNKLWTIQHFEQGLYLS